MARSFLQPHPNLATFHPQPPLATSHSPPSATLSHLSLATLSHPLHLSLATLLFVWQLLILLPHELHMSLLAHLPLLLHTCVVCYGSEASSVLTGVSHAQGDAPSLLLALHRNLAPRSQAMPPTRKQVTSQRCRGGLIGSGRVRLAVLSWCRLAFRPVLGSY